MKMSTNQIKNHYTEERGLIGHFASYSCWKYFADQKKFIYMTLTHERGRALTQIVVIIIFWF